MVNRYLGANRRELRELAEAHEERTRRVSAEELAERHAELKAILDRPPKTLLLVVSWAEDLGLRPTPQQWTEARALPPNSSLREVLRVLGAQPEDLIA